MDYNAQLIIPSNDAKNIIDSILVEGINSSRAKVNFSISNSNSKKSINKTDIFKENIVVNIESKDLVMLRATINSVLRYISVGNSALK
jgi:tRNA threonylcarbamoyladenosine modification (KEOPS) complex  Pcc1 subunit